MAILDGKAIGCIPCNGLGVICRDNFFINSVINFYTISIDIQIGKFALPTTVWTSCDNQAANFNAICLQNSSDEERSYTVLVVGIIPNFVNSNPCLFRNPLVGDGKSINGWTLITSNLIFLDSIDNFLTILKAWKISEGIFPAVCFCYLNGLNFDTISKEMNSNLCWAFAILITVIVPNLSHFNFFTSIEGVGDLKATFFLQIILWSHWITSCIHFFDFKTIGIGIEVLSIQVCPGHTGCPWCKFLNRCFRNGYFF